MRSARTAKGDSPTVMAWLGGERFGWCDGGRHARADVPAADREAGLGQLGAEGQPAFVAGALGGDEAGPA